MLRVADCIADSIRFAIPQPTEWQRIGNQTRSLKLRRARVPVWREFIVHVDEKLTAFLELLRLGQFPEQIPQLRFINSVCTR